MWASVLWALYSCGAHEDLRLQSPVQDQETENPIRIRCSTEIEGLGVAFLKKHVLFIEGISLCVPVSGQLHVDICVHMYEPELDIS